MCHDSQLSGKAGRRRSAIETSCVKERQGERLGVLIAYPRLARRLAAVGCSTAESTREQANASLDALTDEEHATFTGLDIPCTGKFGFPFMIAVCDLDGIGILVAFKSDRETGLAEACGQDKRIAE